MRDDDAIRWARATSVAGWLFLLAYLGVVTGIVRRAAALNDASFEDGLWWQRVEIISFASLPQNLVVLVPAVAAGVVGTVIARSVIDQSVILLRQLVRVAAGTCYVVIVIGAFGILGVFFRNSDGVGDVSALLGRLGGILMAVGMIKLCLEAERTG
ncbi:hypothetical protein [Ilumatobacter sp.]|uniref:hypothetical protein n=1 Tax=Ilumatobacter sp. TaxID=1967498 RepID=UPI003AF742BE